MRQNTPAQISPAHTPNLTASPADTSPAPARPGRVAVTRQPAARAPVLAAQPRTAPARVRARARAPGALRISLGAVQRRFGEQVSHWPSVGVRLVVR